MLRELSCLGWGVDASESTIIEARKKEILIPSSTNYTIIPQDSLEVYRADVGYQKDYGAQLGISLSPSVSPAKVSFGGGFQTRKSEVTSVHGKI